MSLADCCAINIINTQPQFMMMWGNQTIHHAAELAVAELPPICQRCQELRHRKAQKKAFTKSAGDVSFFEPCFERNALNSLELMCCQFLISGWLCSFFFIFIFLCFTSFDPALTESFCLQLVENYSYLVVQHTHSRTQTPITSSSLRFFFGGVAFFSMVVSDRSTPGVSPNPTMGNWMEFF